MIQIQFLGGAKKLFLSETLTLDKSNITIDELLAILVQQKPTSTPSFDTANLLIVVNGVDSSALDGRSTILTNNDAVSIIPIIHGGSSNQLRLTIHKKHVQVILIPSKQSYNVDLLDQLRKNFPRIKLQAVSSKFILDRYHLERIVSLSIQYEKSNMLLSNSFETDLLMRFAISGQISDAIETVGIKHGRDFFLIALGSKKDLDRLCATIPCSVPIFAKGNSAFLRRHFHLTQKQLNSAYSENPLADILVEKAATLFR